MLRDGGNSGDDLKTALFRNVVQFNQGIFVRPVAIHADQDARSLVSVDI